MRRGDGTVMCWVSVGLGRDKNQEEEVELWRNVVARALRHQKARCAGDGGDDMNDFITCVI